jgi:hypothetical protein
MLLETTGPAVGAFATGDLTGDLVGFAGLTVADVFDAVGATVVVEVLGFLLGTQSGKLLRTKSG